MSLSIGSYRRVVLMPVGPFKDFAECVAANQDKDDPEAYCASIEKQASSISAMAWIIADLTYDSDETAREAERLAREGKLAGVSVDLADMVAEIEILATDEDGFPIDWVETITQAEIIGATQVGMPAFADAHIDEVDGRLVAFLAPEGLDTSDRRIITSGALTWREEVPLFFTDENVSGHEGAVHVGNLTNFRRALTASFEDPGLPTLTKPIIEDGKLVGHGAGWGTCHTAFRNACVTAPHSDYSDQVPIYQHPAGDHHAPLNLNREEARSWYAQHCEQVGLGSVGEDDLGIWVVGGTTLDDGEVFLSGDWRSVDGELELVSFLVVENPGFPTAMVANESQTALLAAGIVTSTDPLVSRIIHLEAQVSELTIRDRAAQMLADLENV